MQRIVIRENITKVIFVPIPTSRDISTYLAKIYSPTISPIAAIKFQLPFQLEMLFRVSQ